MRRGRVLFVDDQKGARDLFLRMLDADRYEAIVAASVVEAETILAREHPDVVLTDLRMPKIDGLEGLDRFKRIAPDIPVILVTAFGTVETAVEAMRRGAFDYIRKPFDAAEIEIVVERALQHRILLAENARLRGQVADSFGVDNIIHASQGMREAIAMAERVAPTDHTVLVQGESGTGKDLFAKLIHYSSPRAASSFVALNCSAIPEHLLESELFGYEKGAFSGADASNVGFVAKADGGSLFLDEIGDMSTNLQPKLLRVLQDGEYYPVGGRTVTHADVRVICASNRDLMTMVEKREFREDLYYRVNTVCVNLPPLRERREDIPLLVRHFFARLQDPATRRQCQISDESMRYLEQYDWPGNVRELEHVMARALLVCNGDEVRVEDLPPEVRSQPNAPETVAAPSYREAKAQFERAYFARLLMEANDNIQHAARLAGIHRTTLYEKLTRLNLNPHGDDRDRPDEAQRNRKRDV